MSGEAFSDTAAIRAACQQELTRRENELDRFYEKIVAVEEREFTIPPLPEYSPLQELVTEQQRHLLTHFNHAGVFGLARCMQQIAEFEAHRQHTSHNARPRETPQEEEEEEDPVEFEDTEPELDSDVDSEYNPERASESVTSKPRRPNTRRVSGHDGTACTSSEEQPLADSQGSEGVEQTIEVRHDVEIPSELVDVEMSGHLDTPLPFSSQSLPSDIGNKSAQKSWQLILDDAAQDKRLVANYYAATLPQELTRALIIGDLPRRMQEDDFRRKMQPYVELKDTQGTYCVYVARGAQAGSSTQDARERNANIGMSLKLKEIIQVYDDIKLYISVDSPGSSHLARSIDEIRDNSSKPPKDLDYEYARRYGSGEGHDKFAYHKQWLRWLKKHYYDWAKAKLNTMEEYLLDIPIRRCFCYVGLSSRVQGRAPEHWKTKSSRVFQLFVAVLKFRFGNTFTVTPFTYQIMHTIDESHVGIDEKITTLICGAYTWHGGLSIVPAGLQRGRRPRNPNFEGNLEFMRSTGSLVADNCAIGQDKSRVYDQSLGQIFNWPTCKELILQFLEHRKKELEDAVVEAKEALDSMTPTREELQMAAVRELHQFLKQKYEAGRPDTY